MSRDLIVKDPVLTCEICTEDISSVASDQLEFLGIGRYVHKTCKEVLKRKNLTVQVTVEIPSSEYLKIVPRIAGMFVEHFGEVPSKIEIIDPVCPICHKPVDTRNMTWKNTEPIVAYHTKPCFNDLSRQRTLF